MSAAAPAPVAAGKLPDNIVHFARVLRRAGLPIGPGAVLDAIEAAEIVGVGPRDDFRAALRCVFVKRREHTVVFEQAFAMFWRRRGYLEKMIAALSPTAAPQMQPPPPPPGAARTLQALSAPRAKARGAETLECDARFTTSGAETLRVKDFAQMSAEEIARAAAAVAALTIRSETVKTRRWRPARRGRLDPRATMRQSCRAGASTIAVAWRARLEHPAPLVALCDISGSMSDYTPLFLHFLHALTRRRGRVRSFLFGTRLTNVTRALRAKDVDVALAACGRAAQDWSGGTRIGESLHVFNRDWSRRVLGQGAICLLFTDGLDRDGLDRLGAEMERLHKSCRRLIWVNPLLRYAAFQPKASGVRAMLAHVDEFRPIHNLAAIEDLVQALSDPAGGADPRRFLASA